MKLSKIKEKQNNQKLMKSIFKINIITNKKENYVVIWISIKFFNYFFWQLSVNFLLKN